MKPPKIPDGVKQCNFCGHYTPALDAIADRVLAHKPKPKSKPARKRARRAKKIAQAADV